MKITNFKSYNMDRLVHDIYTNERINSFTKKEIEYMLKPVTLSFCLEGINKLQAILLYERDFVITCINKNDNAINDDTNPVINHETPHNLMKEGNRIFRKAKKYFLEWIVDGISVKDASYCLPLCVPIDVSISITGDKLFDLYELLFEYPVTMKPIHDELDRFISQILKNKILKFVTFHNHPCYNIYSEEMSELYNSDKIVNVVGCDEFEKYFEHNPHQVRSTTIMKTSIDEYLSIITNGSNVTRENIMRIPHRDLFKYYIPISILSDVSKRKTFISIMDEYEKLFHNYCKIYSNEFVSQYIPNAAYIMCIENSTNYSDMLSNDDFDNYENSFEHEELYTAKFKALNELCPNWI